MCTMCLPACLYLCVEIYIYVFAKFDMVGGLSALRSESLLLLLEFTNSFSWGLLFGVSGLTFSLTVYLFIISKVTIKQTIKPTVHIIRNYRES